MTGKFFCPLAPAVFLAVVLVMVGGASALPHEKVIFSLSGDYAGPRGTLLYSAGTFYGTTPGGGYKTNGCSSGCGTVFALVPKAGGGVSFQVLYQFLGGTNDGASPIGNLAMDSAGNLYGATAFGGVRQACPIGCGTAFKLSRGTDGQWTESIIQFFSFAVGTIPQAGLTIDASGNLYGTTSSGANGYGSVYKLTPNVNGTWSETVLYKFLGQPDGEISRAEVTLDTAGNVYGTTTTGGSSSDGIVFQLVRSATGEWTENVLYDFVSTVGCTPVAPVWIDSAGNLYGTAAGCGVNNAGAVYELSPGSEGWTETTIHSFGGPLDGALPQSPLTPDKGGNLWGTTLFGGAENCGTVYVLMRGADGSWTEYKVYTFVYWGDGSTNASEPFSGVTFGDGKTMYGTSALGGTFDEGSIYQVTP
jgi:uncharacterized repeat protein (TIGR03803 family)